MFRISLFTCVLILDCDQGCRVQYHGHSIAGIALVRSLIFLGRDQGSGESAVQSMTLRWVQTLENGPIEYPGKYSRPVDVMIYIGEREGYKKLFEEKRTEMSDMLRHFRTSVWFTVRLNPLTIQGLIVRRSCS
jgi:hypothetical protein